MPLAALAPLLLALTASVALGVPAAAQNRGAPPMSFEENEARQMSMTLAVGCSPRRHNRVPDSESMIERARGDLAGTAAFYHNFEGTFVVLEEYDEDLNGHCLVFGSFGGELEPGSFPVQQLSMEAVEAEVGAEDHGYFSMSLVRTPDEDSLFVIQSGSLELLTVEPSSVTGTFSVSGFLVEGTERTDGLTWTGSFTAMPES